MAIVKFGGGVSDIRGSIAGNVFSRSRAGAVVRSRTKPIDVNSDKQSQVRQNFQEAAAALRALTTAQINAWKDYADQKTAFNKLGDGYTPQPSQPFIQKYLVAKACGITPLLEPNDTDDDQPTLSASNFTFSSENGVLIASNFEAITASADTTLQFQATPVQSPARRSLKSAYRQILVATVAAYSAQLLNHYIAEFGDAGAVGDIIGLRVRAVNTENLNVSDWLEFRQPIAAA